MSVAVAERNELHVLDRTGDRKIEFDPKESAEVEAARAQFRELRAQNYMAYTTDRSGSGGQVVKDFDPTAEQTIMSPQMVGG